jgi:membrane protein
MSVAWAQLRREIVPVAKQTWADFQRHKGQWLAAAISYFTLFAIAPLLIVVLQIIGLILGQDNGVQNQLYGYLAHNAGKAAASGIRALVEANMSQHRSGAIAQIIGWAIFVFAAIGLFNALQQALDIVWDVEPKKQGILKAFRTRGLGFIIVICVAFILLMSLGINTVLTVAGNALTQISPFFPTVMKVVDFLVSLGVVMALFALLFEYLPDCRIEWRDVWPGAAFTALLFVIGQFLLGWYLGRAGISSTYGAAGGLVVFLVWVNYSSQIMLLGAEFTHVYARRFGSRTPGVTRGAINTRRPIGVIGD